MKWDTSELDEWIEGLETLEKGMAAGGPDLFKAHGQRYEDLARRVGGQTLLALMPEGQDPQEWSLRVQDFMDLVFSQMGSGWKSMEIIYAGREEVDGPSKSGKGAKAITYDDVLEWVRAGVEGGGKDKTAVENTRNRADEQIAYDVLTAIRQQRLGFADKDYTAITDRLEAWVESRVLAGDFSDLLLAVLDAWLAALGPVMEQDLSEWADELIAAF